MVLSDSGFLSGARLGKAAADESGEVEGCVELCLYEQDEVRRPQAKWIGRREMHFYMSRSTR